MLARVKCSVVNKVDIENVIVCYVQNVCVNNYSKLNTFTAQHNNSNT